MPTTMLQNNEEYAALVTRHSELVWKRYWDELELIKIEKQLTTVLSGEYPKWMSEVKTCYTDEELTDIYNRANKLDPKRLNPITTERIFKAMRVMGRVK